MDLDWTKELVDQLDWHWRVSLRPRLDGLTDEEYFDEPFPGCWNVRLRGESGAPLQGGSGAFVIEFQMPAPEPAPVTTIAWRLGHVIVGVLGMRSASHFSGPPTDYMTHDYAGTAAGALNQLDDAYAHWITGVRGLDPDGLARPCGAAEGPVRRVSDGHAGAAHQPGDDPPRRRDRPAARPVPLPTLNCLDRRPQWSGGPARNAPGIPHARQAGRRDPGRPLLRTEVGRLPVDHLPGR